ncbi:MULTISPECIES: hypothetical protein [unclassified Kitasatospora]|uniref:hypothetical protein n=1 Tax=unclassified Kitasatospora TaxID=2633591 RepID=UPI0024763724|nr:hypothetical protein [Kitasatospora sp. MAA19]MDH6704378.1 hypothetical protein [Kitasatospora sp. MAA19]
MKSADTEFVGGPLDGRILPIPLGPLFGVPKTYKVPVPAHGDVPARTLVYVRSKQVRGISWFWRYEFDEAATSRASG